MFLWDPPPPSWNQYFFEQNFLEQFPGHSTASSLNNFWLFHAISAFTMEVFVWHRHPCQSFLAEIWRRRPKFEGKWDSQAGVSLFIREFKPLLPSPVVTLKYVLEIVVIGITLCISNVCPILNKPNFRISYQDRARPHQNKLSLITFQVLQSRIQCNCDADFHLCTANVDYSL